jgi:MAF protein
MTSLLPLLLASASPRRRRIITQLDLPHSVCVSPVDEDALQAGYSGAAEGMAQWTAEHKAWGALTLPEAEHRLVIAADTTVILDDTVLGKPRDEQHARELLQSLRGRWHSVVTGVVVGARINGQAELVGASCSTPVLMRPYSDAEIAAYIATGDPLDKAGAYGIQHPQFQPTERIAGCYLNVVGLPLCTLRDLLAHFDIYPGSQAQQREQRADAPCPWSDHCQVIPLRL